MQSGFYSSTHGDVLGWGLDFNNSNQYFIIANGSRTNLGAFSGGDANRTIRLDYDLLTNQASLSVNDTQIGSSVAGQSNTATRILTADGLFTRQSSKYQGIGTLSITSVPEPSTSSLALLAALTFTLKRRR
ncbi:PEP-CTERM sorting domain-containing protein [Rubritalea tangerina]|uniref:PEP-CTERM sorting domain-containing protein n=1 Tax=Rubritalea tangerina TaxID=430798 RepID=A0ABW4ZGD4_9BACT